MKKLKQKTKNKIKTSGLPNSQKNYCKSIAKMWITYTCELHFQSNSR